MQGIKHGLCVFVCEFIGIERLVRIAFTVLLKRKLSKIAKVVALPGCQDSKSILILPHGENNATHIFE